ncbi:MAG: U32 family peptidase [Verrucomicrobiota bacterium]|nr:U32 family peptidase [Verrucomicrobiota bacterium]
MNRKKPLLLSPAGDWECLRAAIENGADAIYFGLEEFNARMRAKNFTTADLPEIMSTLHARGVKGYVTMNTLIFPAELSRAGRQLELCAAAGVDAMIIQDIGLIRLSREISPALPIHGSTQMTVTSGEGITFAKGLGAELVVLARETSLKELRKLRNEHPEIDLPLEMFIHGALCVAYSGQCLTSESLGGRSANRGECAQACRMTYEMVVDGKKIDLGDKKYLLSPQDLSGLEAIPELIDLGITCLKIEGRLKAPEYVANITRVYRKAINEAWEKHCLQPQAEDRYEMEMAFSRGLYPGWFGGVNHQELVHARFGKKRGVFLGVISRVGDIFVEFRAEAPLTEGDGIVFDQGKDTDQEQGGRIWRIDRKGEMARISFEPGKIDFLQLREGNRIWKTNDPRLDRKVRATYETDKILRKLPIDIAVKGGPGEPLVVTATIPGEAFTAGASSTIPLQIAQKHPLTPDKLREQFARLGTTPFELRELDMTGLVKDCILPVSELNKLRRDLAVALENKLRTHPGFPVQAGALDKLRGELFKNIPAQPDNTTSPALITLCRTHEQVLASARAGIKTIYLDYEDPRRYTETIQSCREQFAPEIRFISAIPRIQKQGETGLLKMVSGCGGDGFLIRNYGGIDYFTKWKQSEKPDALLVGDFSLNVANEITADAFLSRGLDFLTVSYDLNIEQTMDLLLRIPAHLFEITLHQHMPMFHMEHCAFAAFMSTGTDYTNCGRPCEKHQVQLKDRVGQLHPLKADAGCRNTLFNAVAQTGAEYYAEFLRTGIRRYRIEFVNETPEETEKTIRNYQMLLAQEINGSELWRNLRLINQLGVTRGTLAHHH